MAFSRVLSLAAASWLVPCAAETVWHLVDVGAAVCDGEHAEVRIPLDEIPASARSDNYIVSFLRSSTDAAIIDFTVTDASTPPYTLTAQTVTLQAITANRKLRVAAARGLMEEMLEDELGAFSEEGDFHETFVAAGEASDLDDDDDADADADADDNNDDDKEQGEDVSTVAEDHKQSGRRLGTSRRRGAFAASPRRRTAMAASPRRRRSPAAPAGRTPGAAPAASPSSMTPSRRRTVTPAGAPPYGSAGGPAYGYPGSAGMNQGFGGRPPMQTGYGYSGPSAYTANSGAKLALAAGAGVLVGVGASMAAHRMMNYRRSLGETCSAGGQQYASCSACRSQHSPASECSAQISPKVDLARDDLMTSAFALSGATFPLTVSISSIVGKGFNSALLCGNSTDSTPEVLLLGLTRVVRAASATGAERKAEHKSNLVVNLLGLVVLGCCCCAACVLLGRLWNKATGSGKNEQQLDHYPGMSMGPPQPLEVQPQYVQQAHGYGSQPAYGHGQYKPGMPAPAPIGAYS